MFFADKKDVSQILKTFNILLVERKRLEDINRARKLKEKLYQTHQEECPFKPRINNVHPSTKSRSNSKSNVENFSKTIIRSQLP